MGNLVPGGSNFNLFSKPELVALAVVDGNFVKKDIKLPIALGKSISGVPIVGDLNSMPHLLIAGTTGSGKSVCINTIIISILYKAKPDEVKFILKRVFLKT